MSILRRCTDFKGRRQFSSELIVQRISLSYQVSRPRIAQADETFVYIKNTVEIQLYCTNQWCGLRPTVLRQDRYQKFGLGLGLARCGLGLAHCGLGLGLGLGLAHCGLGLGLAGLVLCCHTLRHNDLEGHSNFLNTIFSFSVLCLEHHYCKDQQWRSPT